MGPELLERLRGRRPEIEAALLARVQSVEDPSSADAEYLQGLRGTVATAVEHALAVLGGGEDPPEVPPQLATQARLAARSGVELDVVLRRYLAGYTLLCDFLLQEMGQAERLQRALRTQAVLLEQVVSVVTRSYKQEMRLRRGTVEHRRTEQVRKLLAGSPVDSLELGYELEGWHLGLVARGPGAPAALRELAGPLGRRLLAVRPDGEAVWAWLGGMRRLGAEALAERAGEAAEPGLVLAIGEPGHGLAGWRLTHRQARAALPIALRRGVGVVSYCEVAVLASVLTDEVLTSSLAELYLAPLAQERDGGAILRETLRAYFDAGRNVASAAAALGVSRQTVNSRLHTIEERIGRHLTVCVTELETALRIWELESRSTAPA